MGLSFNDKLAKIKELKHSNDFASVYDFLDELSTEGELELLSKACEEGLWEKKTLQDQNVIAKNVLHVACETGNLKLVKSLIECGCDKEVKNNYGDTPLIAATMYGQFEVV